MGGWEKPFRCNRSKLAEQQLWTFYLLNNPIRWIPCQSSLPFFFSLRNKFLCENVCYYLMSRQSAQSTKTSRDKRFKPNKQTYRPFQSRLNGNHQKSAHWKNILYFSSSLVKLNLMLRNEVVNMLLIFYRFLPALILNYGSHSWELQSDRNPLVVGPIAPGALGYWIGRLYRLLVSICI